MNRTLRLFGQNEGKLGSMSFEPKVNDQYWILKAWREIVKNRKVACIVLWGCICSFFSC